MVARLSAVLFCLVCWSASWGGLPLAAAETPTAADDLLITDFEGENYGDWKVEGTAFGNGPAQGTLPGQMHVDGFHGRGLVNSFLNGDDSTGTLTSPPFRIQRHYLQFLIGGGGWKHETCLNLLVEDKVVRTAAGPNTVSGGSERLAPAEWDVSDLADKEARLQIVDSRRGGWGHINVDQILQTNARLPALIANPTREIVVAHQFLNFPVKNGAPKRNITIRSGDKDVRFFEMELADAEPDWWAPLDVSQWAGEKLVVQVDQLLETSQALKQLQQSDQFLGEPLYREPLRAQLHFSPRRGWNNDPNGMVWSEGLYHLFFQHNPYGWNWGNMHWGHAVSPDMVHWQELPIAIYPYQPNDAVFSGSAVVDKDNTSGWKQGDHDLLLAAYTSTGRGECIVYSNDAGRTWHEYEGNPVVKHQGRDPRLLWHADSKQWVMAVYNEDPSLADKSQVQGIVFYTSPDLKHWTRRSRIGGFFECPDLFELPVQGEPNQKQWVLTAASSEYMVGQFDGQTFTPSTPKLKGHQGHGFYAAQTFTNEPQGRTVQMGWLQTATPGMPFNQAMSLPLELSLHKTSDGPRLAWNPVAELQQLRDESHKLTEIMLTPTASEPFAFFQGELVELRAEWTPDPQSVLTFQVRGVPVVYDAGKQELSIGQHRVHAPLRQGRQKLIVYADRTCLEIFAGDGQVYVPWPVLLKPEEQSVRLSVTKGTVKFHSLEGYTLHSSWR